MEPDLRDSLAAQASILIELASAAISPDLDDAGLTYATFELLSGVRALGDEATQVSVARRLGLSAPTLSEAVRDAVRLGWLTQAVDATDGRKRRLQLTPAGNAAVARVLDGLARTEEKMTRGIEASELDTARRVLWHATGNLARSMNRP